MALPATDAFTRADGTLGGVGNWTTVTACNGGQIVSNAVEPTDAGGTDSAAYWNADTFPDDQYAQDVIVACVTSTARAGGVINRCSNAAKTFYRQMIRGPLGASAATVSQKKVVAGTATTIQETGSQTVNANDVIKGEVIGSTLKLYVNGVALLTNTDAAIATGACGVILFTGGVGVVADVIIDTWEGGAAASSVPYTKPLAASRPFPFAPGSPVQR